MPRSYRRAAAISDDSKDRFSRIFDVLELLAANSGGLTVTEISKQLALPLSSAHNLLQRLVAVDAVTVTDDLRYSIGGRAVRYGIRIMEGLQVRTIARRHLERLARVVAEDVYLAERFGARVTYTDRVEGHAPIALDIRLGQSIFLHATAVGKLFAAYHDDLRDRVLKGERTRLTANTIVEAHELAAELDRVRERGYSISEQEAVKGIAGLAIPVMDARHRLVAAIHLSALAGHWTLEQQALWLRETSATAEAVERDLGRLRTDRG